MSADDSVQVLEVAPGRFVVDYHVGDGSRRGVLITDSLYKAIKAANRMMAEYLTVSLLEDLARDRFDMFIEGTD